MFNMLKCRAIATIAMSLLTACTCDTHLKSYMRLNCAMSAMQLCNMLYVFRRGPCIAALSGKVLLIFDLILFLNLWSKYNILVMWFHWCTPVLLKCVMYNASTFCCAAEVVLKLELIISLKA